MFGNSKRSGYVTFLTEHQDHIDTFIATILAPLGEDEAEELSEIEQLYLMGFSDLLGSTIRVSTAEISARGPIWFDTWQEALRGARSEALLAQADKLMEDAAYAQSRSEEAIDMNTAGYFMLATILYQSQGHAITDQRTYEFYRDIAASH